MKTTCEACHTVYESLSDDPGQASCPCCEHINRPKGRVETAHATPASAEDTADHGEEPVKTMVYPADGDWRETGITEAKALRSKSRQALRAGTILGLTAIENGQPARLHPIRKSRMTIGRGRCDLRVRDPEVSREHCVIEVYDGVAILKDLTSANGTLLNGRLIREHIMKEGDRIQLGSTVFRFTVKTKAA